MINLQGKQDYTPGRTGEYAAEELRLSNLELLNLIRSIEVEDVNINNQLLKAVYNISNLSLFSLDNNGYVSPIYDRLNVTLMKKPGLILNLIAEEDIIELETIKINENSTITLLSSISILKGSPLTLYTFLNDESEVIIDVMETNSSSGEVTRNYLFTTTLLSDYLVNDDGDAIDLEGNLVNEGEEVYYTYINFIKDDYIINPERVMNREVRVNTDDGAVFTKLNISINGLPVPANRGVVALGLNDLDMFIGKDVVFTLLINDVEFNIANNIFTNLTLDIELY